MIPGTLPQSRIRLQVIGYNDEAVTEPIPDKESFRKLIAKMELAHQLQRTIGERLASFKSEEEKREADALITRVFAEDCAFDRKHKYALFLLAIAPQQVSWRFKLRERLHRLLHHH